MFCGMDSPNPAPWHEPRQPQKGQTLTASTSFSTKTSRKNVASAAVLAVKAANNKEGSDV
jgi:hypothetical protein